MRDATVQRINSMILAGVMRQACKPHVSHAEIRGLCEAGV